MARNILFEVTVLNGSTPVTLRMAHASASSAGVQINGYQWLPLVTKRPTITASWSDSGVFQQGSISYGPLSFRMSEAYDNNKWSAYEWTGALARIFIQNSDNEGDFASYKQIFEGTVSSLNRQGAIATVELLGPQELLNRDLLSIEYAGTNNAEGPASLKGKLKPIAFGNCQNVDPVQVDPTRYIYQVHGYGPVQGITPYDFGQALDPAKNKGDASDYATLANLTLAPGEWATCAAQGMFRLGGATDKKVTADVSVGGMSVGIIILSLLTQAGIPGAKIAIGLLPQNWSFYAKDQTSIGDVAQQAAFHTGNWLFADGTGTWQTMDFYSPKAPITLNADRSSTPLVKDYREINAAPPVWKVRVGHTKCWSVHSSGEVSASLAINSDDVQAAKDAAQRAQEAAQTAQADATQARQRLDAIESDGILDRSEKADIVQRFGSYTAERTGLLAQGLSFLLPTQRAAYDNAYSQLKTYLEGLSPAYTDSTQNTPIDRATFSARFNAYWEARQVLLNAIDTKAKSMSDWTGVSGPGKPADNATVGAPIGTNVGDVPAGTVVDAIKDSTGTVKPARDQIAAAKAALDASISTANDKITQIQGSVNTIVGTSIPDLARRITDAEGVNTTQGQTLTTYGTQITNVTQQASTTAGNLATLTQTVQAGNLNLLKNGGFDNGLVNWNTVGTWQVASLATAVYGRHVYSQATANNQTLWIYSELMPVKGGLTYAASARMRVTGTTGRARLDVEWFDANMQQITPNAYGNSTQAPKEFGEASRASTAAVGTAPNGTVWARIRLIGELLSIGDQVAFQQAKFEIGAAPTAYSSEATTTQAFTAIQTTNEQVAQLSTTVGTQGSTITSLQTATSNLQGDMAAAQTRLIAGSPNLLGNGGFEDGMRAWFSEIGTWVPTTGNMWGSYVYWDQVAAQTTGERAVVLTHNPVLFDPGWQFTFTADVDAWNAANNAYARLEVWFYSDAAMTQQIGQPFAGPSTYNLSFGNTPGQNRKNLAVSGISPNYSQAMWVKCRVIVCNMTAGKTSGAAVRQAKFERGPVPTSYSNEVSLTQSYQAISSLDGQRATMQSQLNTQGASINDLRTSTTTLQGSVAQVTQRLVAGSPNLLPNGGFENGRNSWADVIGNWGANNGLGDAWGSYIFWGGSGATTDGERYVIADSYPFVIEGNAQFALSADANIWNSSGNAYCRLEAMFYSDTAATNEIGHVWGPNVTQPSFWNEPGYNRQRLATFGTSPAGTQRCRVRLVAMGMFNGSNSGAAFRQIKFERGTTLTPYSGEASALQNYQVLSTATQQLASLTNTVSAQGATVSTQQIAISELQGRTGAYWQVQAAVPGQRAQLSVWANNAGAGVDIGGDVRFSGSLNVGADSGGNRMKITNQNIQVFDSNGTRRVAFGLNF